jgi:hypothetical protein
MVESYAAQGPAGAEGLISFLWDEDSWVVSEALSTLEKIGPPPHLLCPGLWSFIRKTLNSKTVFCVF